MLKFLLLAAILFIAISLLTGRSPARTLGRVFGRFLGGLREGMDGTRPKTKSDVIDVQARERDVR